MTGSTIERARGRWREILPRLGIETKFLTNRHGPCPLCGGRDRFRFDDRDGGGSYYCNQCGSGRGLTLVRKRRGWDFKTAVDEIDKIIGGDAQLGHPEQEAGNSKACRRALVVEQLLAAATDDRIVGQYLRSRGIATSPVATLLGHPQCCYFDEDHKRLIGRFPAVIAPIHGTDGSLQSAQRIYLDGPKPHKKTLPAVSTITGAAARLLAPQNGVLGIGEGVISALSAGVLFNVPVWAALSANGIESFVPPDDLAELHVFGDNDHNYVGQAAAYALAKRVSRDRPEITVSVRIPSIEGDDFNNVLRASQ